MPDALTRDTRERIFRAALEIFSQKGFAGARMQEIADRAEINKALLHYYFRSKEKLYQRVFVYIYTDHFRRLGELVPAEVNFRDGLKKLIDRYMDIIRANPEIPHFLLRESADGGERVRETLARLLREQPQALPVQRFVEEHRRAVERGEIRPGDPLQLLLTVLGACLFYFITKPILGAVLPVDTRRREDLFLARRKREILQIIYDGIKREPPHA